MNQSIEERIKLQNEIREEITLKKSFISPQKQRKLEDNMAQMEQEHMERVENLNLENLDLKQSLVQKEKENEEIQTLIEQINEEKKQLEDKKEKMA